MLFITFEVTETNTCRLYSSLDRVGKMRSDPTTKRSKSEFGKKLFSIDLPTREEMRCKKNNNKKIPRKKSLKQTNKKKPQ